MRSISLLFFFISSSLLVISALSSNEAVHDSGSNAVDHCSLSSKPSVQIIFTKTPENIDPEVFNLRILSAVLGSKAAAKEALVYNYGTVVNAFSAKLTPAQAAKLSKQPGVLLIIPSKNLQLQPGGPEGQQ